MSKNEMQLKNIRLANKLFTFIVFITLALFMSVMTVSYFVCDPEVTRYAGLVLMWVLIVELICDLVGYLVLRHKGLI